ncbi:MAG: hypothetical protein HRU38_07985 [Saccharospirillaceae bacterium]|nr:hypothetical protein [Pseudomonadales bacterium]NRB78593.1 hypothetical protein [Saccharospirillaceae bacterium]
MKSSYLETQCISSFEILENELGKLPNLTPSNHSFFYKPDQLKTTSFNDQIQDIYYQNDLDGRLTNSYWGVIGSSKHNISALKNINILKTTFQQNAVNLKQSNQNKWLNLYQKINTREGIISKPLTTSGLSRLHLRQTYRQIPILGNHPKKIAFSWYTSGRSIKKMNRQQVLQKLLALGEDKTHIQLQLNLLSNVKDSHFAQVQNQAPTIRTNILYQNLQTQSFNTSLPIFFELDSKLDFPYITQLPDLNNQQRIRKVRNDIKIDNECFLKSLRIHRYL